MSLIAAPAARLLALSESAAAMLDFVAQRKRGELSQLDGFGHVTQPDQARHAHELLAEGVLDGYEARREIRSTTGTLINLQVSLRVVRRDGPTAYAVSVFAPAFAEPGDGAERHNDVTNCAGTIDAAYRIEHVSSEAPHVLGRTANELLLVSLLDLVHRDDATALVRAFEKATDDDTEVELLGRFADGHGAWRWLRLVIRPIGENTTRFGFMLTPVGDSPSIADAYRVAELEQRLERIAHEVQAAGKLAGFARLPALAEIRGLDGLTARQLEILSRLLHGERVPAIAQSMYLSQSTVRNHLSNVFKKVGVHSQAALLNLLRAE